MYKFWIKTGVLYPKIHIWSGKNKTIVLFTLKNEVFAKQFDQNVQIMDKKWSFVHKNVHLVPKMERFVLFTLKLKFCPKISPDCTNFG